MAKEHNWFMDDGYGDGKAVTGEGTGEVFNPAKDTEWDRLTKRGELLIPYHVIPLVGKPKKRSKEDKVDPLSYIRVIDEDGQEWVVGQGAITQDDHPTRDGQENKHETETFPIFLKTMLGLMAQGEKNLTVELLGMALPVEYEEDEERHKLLEEKVVKWHKCTIILADDRVLETEVVVKELQIRKQAECALFDHHLDEEGNIKDRDNLRKFNVVCDIGAGTLNVYSVNNLVPVDAICFQTDEGMYKAYILINDRLEQLRGGKVGEVLVPGIIKSGVFLNKDNQEVSIENIVKRAYEIHAGEVVSTVQTKLKGFMARVHTIIWVGGGVELMGEEVKTRMGNKVNQVFSDRFSNARGGRKILLRYVASKAKKKVKAQIGSNVSETEVAQ